MSNIIIDPRHRADKPEDANWGAPAQKAPRRHEVSAPAIYTARLLMRNFDIKPKTVSGRTPPTIPVSEYNIALFVDLCTMLFRLTPLPQQIDHWLRELKHNRASQQDIQKFLGELKLAFDRIPSFRNYSTVYDRR